MVIYLQIQPAGTVIASPQTVGSIHVTQIGTTWHATLANNVKVTYNKNYCGKVCVPEKYSGQMRGICGNYNNNVTDDLKTSFGMPVPDTFIGHHVLGSSHQVYDSNDK